MCPAVKNICSNCEQPLMFSRTDNMGNNRCVIIDGQSALVCISCESLFTTNNEGPDENENADMLVMF